MAPDDTEGGRLLGLRLSFTLPASCYATMLIRELTKQPTGAEHHKTLQQSGVAPAGHSDGKLAAGQQTEAPAAEQHEQEAAVREAQALQTEQPAAQGSEPAQVADAEPSTAKL